LALVEEVGGYGSTTTHIVADVRRVARWCLTWQVVTKITLFQKICQFLAIFFYAEICHF